MATIYTQAVQGGKWERPPDALPDASSWPTWGALRERILTSCKEVRFGESDLIARDLILSICCLEAYLSPEAKHGLVGNLGTLVHGARARSVR